MNGEVWDLRLWARKTAAPQTWWPESQARVLHHARSADWPRTPAGIEEVTCDLIGAELRDHFPGCLDDARVSSWLDALAVRAGESARTALRPGTGRERADEWRPLWAFQRGLALTAPLPSLFDGGPEISREQAEATAELIADRRTGDDWRPPRPVPAGRPLFARDVYGSRFLLTVPFGYWDGEEDHWYAWDVDICGVRHAVGTGMFGSAAEALTEWRDTVGAAGAAATLRPCDPDMAARLLTSCVGIAHHFDYVPVRAEPVRVIREYFRSVRRAQALALSTMVDLDADDYHWRPGQTPGEQRASIVAEFVRWHDALHGGTSPDAVFGAEKIVRHWVSYEAIDERSIFSCSPHRLEFVARRFAPYPEEFRILPEWTRWCAERAGLPAAETAHAIATARFVLDRASGMPPASPASLVWAPVRKAE